MIRTLSSQVRARALSAALLAGALAGCGGNNATENTTATTSTTATNAVAAPSAASSEGAAPAELAAFFPGATLTKKAFPMDAQAAAHLSAMAKVKFSGDEKEWEVFEASQNGARVGYAMMTHLDASSGDTHVVFAVDKSFKITQAGAIDAPKMLPLVAQAVGKSHSSAWKVGQDFKPVAGLSAADSQAAVDAIHKGILILEENFNPNHGAHTDADVGTSPGAASSENAPGHSHEGHAH